MSRAQEIIEHISLYEADVWYHGGPHGDPHPGIYITKSIDYAKKYAQPYSNGKVFKFSLSPLTKIYPKTYWWQDYNMIWRKDQMFHGYDAVRVEEPSLIENIPSLVILNPDVLRRL